ncbi:hypothetical protein [Kitasatospora sp. NPDC059571]|uniref:hypothetical protein n=1 Tax=Kitasatospora sp. NPDC059571 TaxID=3346871 RepID=UPI003687FDA1
MPSSEPRRGAFSQVTAVLQGIGLALLLVAAAIAGLIVWSSLTPDVVEHPSPAATARLDRLRGDPLLTALGDRLGRPPAITVDQCRDTPDGPMPPSVNADFTGAPALDAPALAALARTAGWESEGPLADPALGNPGATPPGGLPGLGAQPPHLTLHKSFDGWRSSAHLLVDGTTTTVEIDATDDDSCP